MAPRTRPTRPRRARTEPGDEVGLGRRALQDDVVLGHRVIDGHLVALDPQRGDPLLHLIPALDDGSDILLLELDGPDPLDRLELYQQVAHPLRCGRAARPPGQHDAAGIGELGDELAVLVDQLVAPGVFGEGHGQLGLDVGQVGQGRSDGGVRGLERPRRRLRDIGVQSLPVGGHDRVRGRSGPAPRWAPHRSPR